MDELTVSKEAFKQAQEYNKKKAYNREKAEKKLRNGEFLGNGTWMVAVIGKKSIWFESQDGKTQFQNQTVALRGLVDKNGTPCDTWENPETHETHQLVWE